MTDPLAQSIAASFDPGNFVKGTEEIDMTKTKNVRWASKLGSQAYGNTTVSGGKVLPWRSCPLTVTHNSLVCGCRARPVALRRPLA